MKYYINYDTRTILKDKNENTPYLKDRGYVEVTKEQYENLRKELLTEWEQEDFKISGLETDDSKDNYEDVDIN